MFLLASCGNAEGNSTSFGRDMSEEYVQTQTMHGMLRMYSDFASMILDSGFTAEIIPGSGKILVRAEVLDEWTELVDSMARTRELTGEDLDPWYEPRTFHRIRILEVFFEEDGLDIGEVNPGDILDINQVGGRVGNRQLITEMAPIAVGDDLIMFLMTGGGGASPHPIQAVYHTPPELASSQTIMEATHTQSISEDLILQSVNPDNNLTLTMGDIIHIYETYTNPPSSATN